MSPTKAKGPAAGARDCIERKLHAGVVLRHHDTDHRVWRTQTKQCQDCHQPFTVTAEEQRFWYEDLRIPPIVDIVRCPACRRQDRKERGIMGRLSEILPRIDSGAADSRERREAVFVITDGARHDLITGTGTIERALAIAAALRRSVAATKRHHDDLLPIMAWLHRRLGHADRAAKIEAEAAALITRRPALRRLLASREAWLADLRRPLRPELFDAPRR